MVKKETIFNTNMNKERKVKIQVICHHSTWSKRDFFPFCDVEYSGESFPALLYAFLFLNLYLCVIKRPTTANLKNYLSPIFPKLSHKTCKSMVLLCYQKSLKQN